MRKRVFLALLLMAVSFIVTPHPNAGGEKTDTTFFAATNHYKWELGGNALYLKPENINDIGSDIPQDITFNFLTELDWGFNIYGRYFFEGGRDNRLMWVHFKDARDESLLEPRQTVGNDPNLNGQGGAVPYAYNSQFDVVQYEYGQSLNLTERVHMRVHVGFEYMQLHLGYRFTAEVTTNNTLHEQSEDVQYEFSGVGPRIGLDLKYKMTKTTFLGVEGAFAILDVSGRFDNAESVVQSNGGVIQNRRDVSFEDELTGALSSIEMHFSVTHNFSAFKERLSISAGYTSYIFETDLANWGGLYIGAKWRA